MKSFDNGGPLDQLFSRARELAGEDPETRREKVVAFVMANVDGGDAKRAIVRLMVERIYDRVFGSAGTADSRNSREQGPGGGAAGRGRLNDLSHNPVICPHCGLNDGHHYVGCRALEDEK